MSSNTERTVPNPHSTVVQLGNLLTFIAKVAQTIRMNSSYSREAASNPHSATTVMYLSDMLHNLSGIGHSLVSGDQLACEKEVKLQLEYWVRHTGGIRHAQAHSVRPELIEWTVEDGISILRCLHETFGSTPISNGGLDIVNFLSYLRMYGFGIMCWSYSSTDLRNEAVKQTITDNVSAFNGVPLNEATKLTELLIRDSYALDEETKALIEQNRHVYSVFDLLQEPILKYHYHSRFIAAVKGLTDMEFDHCSQQDVMEFSKEWSADLKLAAEIKSKCSSGWRRRVLKLLGVEL